MHISLETKQNTIPWDVINALGPHFLWLFFIIGLLFWIGSSRLNALLTRVAKVNIAGVEIEFKQTLEEAVTARGEIVSNVDISRAAKRLAKSSDLIAGAKLLWIDDEPTNNRFERNLFEKAAASVTEAISSDQAQAILNLVEFDVILSDIRRGDDGDAGIKFLARLSAEKRRMPIVFYVGKVSGPVPQGAFGIADRPDELIHLVLDALARSRS